MKTGRGRRATLHPPLHLPSISKAPNDNLGWLPSPKFPCPELKGDGMYWCFRTVVLEKTLENSLDSKEIQPVNPKGNQSWIFIGRTEAEAEAPILGLHGTKGWLIGKDPDAGKDWRQKEKRTAEDEILDSILDSMDMNLSKLQEGSTCYGATKPMSHNYWACASEPVPCNKRSHCNGKPTHCN